MSKNMRIAKTCSEEGCAHPARTRGICKMHYERHWRRGTLPENTGRKSGPKRDLTPLERTLAASVTIRHELHAVNARLAQARLIFEFPGTRFPLTLDEVMADVFASLDAANLAAQTYDYETGEVA